MPLITLLVFYWLYSLDQVSGAAPVSAAESPRPRCARGHRAAAE